MKFVIANRLNPSALLQFTDPLTSLLCATVFELKFYFDFAGYSFIAYGFALLTNLNLTINFNHPFTTNNVVEFWRNWHISLGAFLKKYIYITNKQYAKNRHQVVLLACSIFIISAMWHGGTFNYLLWGLFHATVYYIYLRFTKYWNLPRLIGIGAMIFFFIFGRMLAIDANSGRLIYRLGNLFHPASYFNFNAWNQLVFSISLLNKKAILLGLIFIALEFYQVRIQNKSKYHLFRRPISTCIMFLLFILFGINSGELLYARL